MPAAPDHDLARWYREGRERIEELVSTLPDAAAVPVPASPGWSVHDVVAHLAGICEDVRTGNMAGVATDPWTAAQVERGRVRTRDEVLARWREDAPLLEGFLAGAAGAGAARAVLDLHAHEADLLHALGRPCRLPGDVLAWLERQLLDDFAERVAAAGLLPVALDPGAGDEAAVPADPGSGGRMEVFRSRLGRRTREEVLAYRWSRDPAPYLDAWFIFGPAVQTLGERPGLPPRGAGGRSS